MSTEVSPGNIQGRYWQGMGGRLPVFACWGGHRAGSGTAGVSWQALMGVLSPCLLWDESEEPLRPFYAQIFSPCL